MPKFRVPPDLQIWIDTRKRHRLSHVVIQMARELGMNPKKLGGLNIVTKNLGKLRYPSSSPTSISKDSDVPIRRP